MSFEEFYSEEELDTFILGIEENEDLFQEKFVSETVLEGLDDAEGEIRKQGDKWYVYSDDGKRRLGGPYKSKDEAEKRLKQVEMFKHMKTAIKAEEECPECKLPFSDCEHGFGEIVEAGDTYHNKLSPDSPHNKKHKKIAKKCRKCGSTKNIDLHHTSNSRKNLNKTSGIIPLCRSCHRKLHQGKGSQIADYVPSGDPDLLLTAIACEVLDPENIPNEKLAKANLDKQKDLLYVAFKLVHVGMNGNKDTFLDEELETAQESPKLKLVNMGHTDRVVGVIYDSKYVKGNDDEPSYIICAAAISKYKFPEEAQDILARFQQGKLYFSMEVWFEEAECSSCHKLFEAKEMGCSHMEGRFSRSSNDSRILRGLTFGGAGIVENPADVGAIALAIAKKNKEEVEKMNELEKKVTDLETEVRTLTEAKASAETNVNTLETQVTELKNQIDTLTSKINDLTTEKATIVAEKDSAAAERDSVIAERDDFKTKLDELTTSIEKDKRFNDRLGKLKEAGVDVSNASEDEGLQNIANIDDIAFDVVLKTLSKKVDPVEPKGKAAAGITGKADPADEEKDKFAFLKKSLS